MTYRYWIIDAKTGAYLLEVYPSAGNTTRQFNGVGGGQHTFQLRDDHLTPAQRRDLFYPWRRALVIEWDDVPVYAGVIQSAKGSRSSGELIVAHSEYRVWLSRRYQFGIGTYGVGTRLYTGRSLRGIIHQIVYYSTQGNLSPAWDLPIGFDMYDEAGGQSRDYWNYAFQNAERAIAELQDTDGGPDIDFQPRKVGGLFRAWLRVSSDGTRLGGPSFEFWATGEHPTARDVEFALDGSQMVTGVFAVGKGSEADMRHGEFAVPVYTVPSLDVTVQWKDLDDVGQLTSHAAAEVAAFTYPTEQWALTVNASDVLPNLVPGSTATVWSDGDEWLPDGKSSMRVIAYSMDVAQPEDIKLEVQPL